MAYIVKAGGYGEKKEFKSIDDVLREVGQMLRQNVITDIIIRTKRDS